MGRLTYFAFLTVYFLLNLNTSSIYGQSTDAITCLVAKEGDIEIGIRTYSAKNIVNETYSCWESQLTMNTKVAITKKYNEWRRKEAQKRGIPLVLEMLWHWRLEVESMVFNENVELVWADGIDYPLLCENIVSYPFEHGKSIGNQQTLLTHLEAMLADGNMGDIDDTKTFTRASAIYFGCSFGAGYPYQYTWFACSYCTKESKIALYHEADCPPYTKKVVDPATKYEFCKSRYYLDFYFCEPENPCPSPKPSSRKSFQQGIVKKLNPVQTTKRALWFLVEDVTFQDGVESSNGFRLVRPTKNTEFLWIFGYLWIPYQVYQYSTAKLESLNATMQSLTSSMFSIEIPIEYIIRMYPMMEDGCCIFVFIFIFLLFLLVACAAMLSWLHYTMEKQ